MWGFFNGDLKNPFWYDNFSKVCEKSRLVIKKTLKTWLVGITSAEMTPTLVLPNKSPDKAINTLIAAYD